jgi:hypothetical protein
MTPLRKWILLIMLKCTGLGLVRPHDKPTRDDLRVSLAIERAAHASAKYSTLQSAALLVSIAFYESGFVVDAKGPVTASGTGAYGPWQLMPPVPLTLEGQAKEALRRWETQGPQGYTGETHCPWYGCPLAVDRHLRGLILESAYSDQFERFE